MKGRRADILLFEAGLAKSREEARSLIMEGLVFVQEVRVSKPGDFFAEDTKFIVRGGTLKYVSRGGLKLEKALSVFNIDLNGLVAADVGASTGGFTDCMLQNGARSVYAIDVGYGQLDYRLRGDERVTVMERTNARNMEPSWFPQPPEFASLDLSFISVRLILAKLYECLADNSRAVVLVKPQFEAGRDKVGKNGVVRKSEVHAEVILTVAEFAKNCGYCLDGLDFSPITGPKGNIEFLLSLQKSFQEDFIDDFSAYVQDLVARSHEFHSMDC